MDPRCDTCGASPDFAGPLCQEPVPWEPKRLRLICKVCVQLREQDAIAGEQMEQDRLDFEEHVESCSFCFRNRPFRFQMPGGLLQACAADRKRRGAA